MVLMIIIPMSFVSSSKCIARNLAIDDDNLYFNYMIGSILLPLSEIVSIEKAYEQLLSEGYIYSVERSGYFVIDT